MNITLSSELKNFVNAQVINGCYQNADAVIEDSLRLMIKREKAHLRKAIDDGWEQVEQGDLITASAAHRFLKAQIASHAK